MPAEFSPRRAAVFSLALLVSAFGAGPVLAQVTEVDVGVTPTCPYGIGACWGGAYEALGRLDGVKSVAATPDAYNCTARVVLKQAGALPDVDRWAGQFKSMVGNVYAFRGVEITAEGTVEVDGDTLALRVPGLAQPLPLAPLRDKLQWNFKKSSARQPEPDERDAHAQLAARKKAARVGPLRAQVTGPLKKSGSGYALEVREFFPMDTGVDPYGRR
jgi:hypothetical protein